MAKAICCNRDIQEVLAYNVTDGKEDGANFLANMLLECFLSELEIKELLADETYAAWKIYKLLYEKRIRSNASYDNNITHFKEWRNKQVIEAYKEKLVTPEFNYK